jgi:nucleoid-associated protein YgaU
MKLMLWLVIFSVMMVGCSGPKSAKSVDQETPQIELSDTDEFAENPSEEAATDVNSEPVVTDSAEPVIDNAEPVVTDSAEPVVDNAPVVDAAAPMAKPAEEYVAGVEKNYTVQKNETLMLVAFKLFGDYSKWKTLSASNQDVLKGSTVLKEGMVLKYTAPAEEFVWNPEGLPYLIRTGDTLGKISGNVYGTQKKWKSIWDNNKPLIKDPNLIFAGFTLYYLENGREVATQF